mgnify:CR=1 FL=1
MHLPKLIQDLALILAAASAVALLFRWIRQPIVLGYLIAGILVGPHISIIPTVTESSNVQVWAELGVIFLLFLLGLEFSFRKLLDVGKTAVIAATFEVVLMTALGYAIGLLLGWSTMDALFLGGILAISSTTIILKSFEEMGLKTRLFANLVIGILLVEDLFAVVLLALLSTIAVTRELQGLVLLSQIGTLLAFLAITIPLGVYLLPRFFRMIRPYLNEEIRVVISLSLCLLLVLASTSIGFSPALGAFLMGALMGETAEGERAERLLRPIRDLFAAIFFVSVGMLVNLNLVVEHMNLVILLSVVTILGKIAFSGLGAFISGQDRRTSIQCGLSLGQIGEFSFVIAVLGISLGVIRPELYALAVSVSVVTTFATPYLIRWGETSSYFSKQKQPRRRKAEPKLWDGHLAEFEIHPHFKYSGKSLQEIELREKYGISIVAIERGDRKLLSPIRSDRLMPFDRVIVFGTDQQLAELEKYLRSERFDLKVDDEALFSIERVHCNRDAKHYGKTLREMDIPHHLHGIVLGIERDGKRILNPQSTEKVEMNDILWIYGRRDLIRNWAWAK